MGLLVSPLLLLGVVTSLLGSCSGSSSHSLRYFYTGVSEASPEMPLFVQVGYVNDQPITHYSSNTQRKEPLVPWMKKVNEYEAGYWERSTQILQGSEQLFRVALVNVPKYYNQSGGSHTLQIMYGCELREDGSKGGYIQDAFDGRDYTTFDKETLTWTAADTGAQITKRKREADPAFAQYAKSYLEEECIEWLRRYLDYGRESLQRTERPEVKVTRKAGYDNMETLICRVDGFYPKAIDIAWTRDGEVWVQDALEGLVSPNSDETYYTWRSVRIDPKDRERYRCRVEHDGLQTPVDLAWEEPPFNLGLIIGGVVLAVLLVAGIAGIAVYIKRRQDGYKAAPASDQGSNSSGRGSNVAV